jgi:aldose sugar dehydrogenase
MKYAFVAVFMFALAGCATETASPENAAEAAPTDAAAGRVFETKDYRIRVVPVAEGLTFPYTMTFLPDGGILVAELPGRLRLVRDGKLVPEPIGGIPQVHYAPGRGGFMDLALHPKFAENRMVYFTYDKPGEKGAAPAIGRGVFDGKQLTNVTDIFVADAWDKRPGHLSAYAAFTPDGLIYFTVTDRNTPERAQVMSDHAGKVLRLRDDGSVPPDNPFVGRNGVRPEIYSAGFRDVHGLTVHPTTGEVWTNEHGDEINVMRPGANYGYPYVAVNQEEPKPIPAGIKITEPFLTWNPAINISGMLFYNGNLFSNWKGNLFVGGLETEQVQRIAFAQNPPDTTKPAANEVRETLFDFDARVREVREGPDGRIYFVTDMENGGLYAIEPAN